MASGAAAVIIRKKESDGKDAFLGISGRENAFDYPILAELKYFISSSAVRNDRTGV